MNEWYFIHYHHTSINDYLLTVRRNRRWRALKSWHTRGRIPTVGVNPCTVGGGSEQGEWASTVGMISNWNRWWMTISLAICFQIGIMVSTFEDERPKHDESIRHHDHWSWSLHHGRYKQLPARAMQRYAVSTSQAAHVPIRYIGHCATQWEAIRPKGSQLHSNRYDVVGVRHASDDWRCHISSPSGHRGVWPPTDCNHGPSFRMALGQGRTQRKG